MAILRIKKLIENLKNNTGSVVVSKATSAGYAGSANVATTGASGSGL
jgi:hypothetical protein